jgi:hypothetical protein
MVFGHRFAVVAVPVATRIFLTLHCLDRSWGLALHCTRGCCNLAQILLKQEWQSTTSSKGKEILPCTFGAIVNHPVTVA